MIYKKYNNNSFKLYTINTNKFKTCDILISFYNNYDKNNITKEIVLSKLLLNSTNKYKTNIELLTKFKDLYDIKYNSYTSIIGNISTINFYYSMLDPTYINNKYLNEVLKLIFDIIFNPNINNNEFDDNILKLIKDNIIYHINNQKEDILKYSINKALKLSNYNIYDNEIILKELNNINNSNIYNFYEYMLNNYYCDIYIIGNLNMDKINIMINDLYKNNIIKTNKINIYSSNKINNYINDINIKDNYKESILINIHSLNNLNDKERFYYLSIFNYLYGDSTSLSNKLSSNLRNNNQLCYSSNSYYDILSNYLISYTLIDKKYKNKANRLINKSINDIKKNKFGDEDFNNSKKLYENAINNSLNNPIHLINNYMYHNLINAPLLLNRIDDINNITKKDIVNLSKKIKLHTIYFMKGIEDERNKIN